MKKLLITVFAIAMTSAVGVAFAEEDEAMTVAPNALRTITSTPGPTGPAVYDRDDESMDVAPNALRTIEQSTFIWEEEYDDGDAA